MTLSGWVDKYGRITAYTSAVILLTIFFIRFDAKFTKGNEKLESLNASFKDLSGKVASLEELIRDREKYERWRRQYNARFKRLYGMQGWDYEEVE